MLIYLTKTFREYLKQTWKRILEVKYDGNRNLFESCDVIFWVVLGKFFLF